MYIEFRWNEWNEEHAARHGVSRAEAEFVVRNARRPYPKKEGRGKWLVEGRGDGGRFVQVVFILSPADVVYVIHAMPLGRRRR
jgi:uncharacterized DUF497 family protein